MSGSIQLESSGGLYLPEADLWLDPVRSKPRAFVSHAHAGHFARHEHILATPATCHLLRVRYSVTPGRLQPLDFQQPLQHRGFTIRLFPAGHIFGSAMIHLTRNSDGASLLYTGDFKVRRGITAEEAVFRRADTLVMESTFGKPRFVFPSTTEATGEVLNFVHSALDDGVTPVLMAHSLGKAQEAFAILDEARIPSVLGPEAAKMTNACREAGAGLPEPRIFTGTVPPGHCLVCPPRALDQPAYRRVRAPRSAMLTGWARVPGATFRYHADTVIALSDHADFPGLLEAVQRIQPSRIYTVHGFTETLASELRRLHQDAWSADGNNQLELALRV